MKMMKYMTSIATALFALVACSDADDILSAYHNDPNAVHINAEVGKASADGFTRSNPLGKDADEQMKFNKDDEISVKADGQEAVTYRFNGSEWIPQDSKFLKWESESMTFTAYYPAASYSGGTIDQPTAYPDEASLIAADYMSFNNPINRPKDNNALTLTMQRQMARVVVQVVGFNNQYDENTPINSVTINGVKAYKHSVNNKDKYYALMVPCSAQNNKAFLSLEVGTGNTETLTGIPELVAGKSYTYQLTVGKNKVVVTGITVKDWTSGKTVDGKTTYIPYVTFTADATQTFYLKKLGYFPSNIEYSVGTGDWKTLVADEPIFFGGNIGSLQLRATDNLKGTSDYKPTVNYDFSYIRFGKKDIKVACTGDIRTLLDYKTYKTVETNNAQFYRLFSSCEELTSAPDLPATRLADYCYSNMFVGCSSLTKAPDLPAQELAAGCYENMFSSCTSLQNAPKLSATKLASGCYQSMFVGCSELQEAPELPATELATNCYCEMFKECTNLTSVTMLALSDQITSKEKCCDSWLRNAGTKEGISRKLILKDVDAYYALVDKGYLPDIWKKGNCNVLDGTPYVTFTAEQAQTFKLKNNGYFPSNIEYSVGTGDWKTLVADEPIPFGGDKGNLQLRATENLKGTASDDGSNFSQIIFRNSTKVACTGDIRTLLDYRDFKNVNTSNAKFCMLFMDCTVLTSAPDLPATQLANKCYYYMFIFCTSLTKAPELPAETLASGCYKGMFDGCAKLQEAPELSATKLANSCYQEMFYNCTSLKSAPNLPATTLAPYCYYDMFNSCKNLTSVTMLAPSDQISSTEKCCYGWLTDAGTKEGISRTLKVKDEAAYNALVDKDCLPADYWKKGPCTVSW